VSTVVGRGVVIGRYCIWLTDRYSSGCGVGFTGGCSVEFIGGRGVENVGCGVGAGDSGISLIVRCVGGRDFAYTSGRAVLFADRYAGGCDV